MRSESSSLRFTAVVAVGGLLALGLAAPTIAWAQSDANALYDARCASCHGPGGAGDGAVAKALKTPVPNFADAAYGTDRTDDELSTSIADGKPPIMPGFGKQLKPEQIRALVAHIRRFRNPSSK